MATMCAKCDNMSAFLEIPALGQWAAYPEVMQVKILQVCVSL